MLLAAVRPLGLIIMPVIFYAGLVARSRQRFDHPFLSLDPARATGVLGLSGRRSVGSGLTNSSYHWALPTALVLFACAVGVQLAVG